MKEGLNPGVVSIVVPCFNVGLYIEKFLESVLQQDYLKIDLILVDDGSTDDTGDVIARYRPALHDRLFRVRVVEQENRGLAGAVNAGLKLISGEFLMWPDPDDWLSPQSVRRRDELLREYPSVGLLRSNCEKFDHATGELSGFFLPPDTPTGLYSGLFGEIVKRSTFMAPVSSTLRSSAFLEVYPERRIFESRVASQNLQMLLPIARSYPVLITGETLGTYRIRPDSRSRVATSPDRLLRRHRTVYQTIQETLNQLKTPMPELKVLLREHYDRNVFLPLLFEAEEFESALRLIKEQKLGILRSEALKALVKLAVVFGNASLVGRRLRRCFNRLIRFRGNWEEVLPDR